MKILKQYFLLIINPNKVLQNGLNQRKIIILIYAFFITLFLLNVVNLTFANSNPTSQYSLTPNLNKLNTISIISLLVLVPFYEEAMFRLWINIKKKNIVYSISLLISSVIVLTSLSLINIQSHYIFHIFYVAAFILSVPFFYIMKLVLTNQTLEVPRKKINGLFLLSAVTFSCMHFIGYKLYEADILFLIKNFTVYLIYGYSFGLVRISAGFFYAVALHFLFFSLSLIKYF